MTTEWRHAAFISYSQDDNELTSHASELKKYFDQKFGAMLRTQNRGRYAERAAYFDRVGLPEAGSLSTELRQAVQGSLSLVIVVGRGYLKSPWCLEELTWFREMFKGRPDELKRRLLIVVSEPECDKELTQHERWPADLRIDAVRRQMYARGKPIRVHVLQEPEPGDEERYVRNPQFETKAESLLRHIVGEIPVPTDDQKQDSPRRVMLGPTPPELNAHRLELLKCLQQNSIEVDEFSLDDMQRPNATEAFGVRAAGSSLLVQPYAERAPYLDMFAGGHLATLQGLIEGTLPIWWWRIVPTSGAAPPPGPRHERFFESIRGSARHGSAADLCEQMRTTLGLDQHGDCTALVYIDSSADHLAESDEAREQVMREWSAANTKLICHSFPLNGKQGSELKAIGRGHGVVLLYANIGFDALSERAGFIDRLLYDKPNAPARCVAWFPKIESIDRPHADYCWKTFAVMGSHSGARVAEPERLKKFLSQVAARAKSIAPAAP
jgi:hypothetical protein